MSKVRGPAKTFSELPRRYAPRNLVSNVSFFRPVQHWMLN